MKEIKNKNQISMTSFPSGIVILLLTVPESAASNGVNNDEKHEYNNINNRHFLPVPLQIIQHSTLAGLAIEAQSFRIVIPQTTIRIRKT